MKCLLAQKLGMSQIYTDAGIVMPVTVVSVAPNTVIRVRSNDARGYDAVQVGAGSRKKLTKPMAGQFKELGKFKWVKEFRTRAGDLKRGDIIGISVFTEGDVVDVTSTSKGKGFAGVVKRHHFRGGPASHGHPHNHRAPGSIGCRFPQHVHKGKRMAGHMGFETVTVKNLKVVRINEEQGLMAIKGAIPGSRGTLVKIMGR
ncbi:MAG: 50S ribosomal protein L3 [bacterium]|nr:50S ribosomal protein L3 [bacterium]